MRNFTKIAKLHRMFFKRADEKTFPPGHFSPDANKPGPGNIVDAQWAAKEKDQRDNFDYTPDPSSASGHGIWTPKPNRNFSFSPPKPSPVSIYQNQRLTPKPWTPRQPVARPRPFKSLKDPGDFSPNDTGEMIRAKLMASDDSHAAFSRAMQADAQRILASPYGHLQSNGEVLRGFRYPIDGGTAVPDNGDSEFEEKSLANRPKLPPPEKDRVNNLQ